MRKYVNYFRQREYVFFIGLTTTAPLLLFRHALHIEHTARNLVTSGTCPINGHGAVTEAWLVSGVLIALVGVVVWFFYSRILRFTFLVWGICLLVLCFFSFGWAAGAGEIHENTFKVAEIVSAPLSAGTDTKVLVLGADDKNLVVLVRGENSTGHPEPRYLLRSEIKTFRLVGASSINDFFCK